MPKFLKRTLLILTLSVIGFSSYVFISGKTFLFTAIRYNFANIDDYQKFSNNEVSIATPQPWAEAANYNRIAYPDSLNVLLEELGSVGLLMIRDGQIVFEKYWKGYSDSAKSGSFSVAKVLPVF